MIHALLCFAWLCNKMDSPARRVARENRHRRLAARRRLLWLRFWTLMGVLVLAMLLWCLV